ncbi:hypothetical protein FRB90_011482 [Tulasnella sp. 427]|nr:hypothetical protein FRB90_011482 [Tulasnella sp. 427]
MTAEIASKEKVIQDLKKQLAVKEKIIQDKERQLDIEEHDSRDLKKQLDSQEKMARDLTDQLNASKESEERCKWALKKERERAFQAQIDSVLATRAASTSWRSRGVQVNSQRSPNQDNAVPTQINFSTQTGANADSASQIEEVPTLNSSTSTIAQAVFGLSNRMDQMAVTSAGSAAAQIPVSLLETQTAQIPDPVPRIPPVGEACLPEASVLPQQENRLSTILSSFGTVARLFDSQFRAEYPRDHAISSIVPTPPLGPVTIEQKRRVCDQQCEEF